MADDHRILEAIGGTPLVELRRVVLAGHARVLVKVESQDGEGASVRPSSNTRGRTLKTSGSYTDRRCLLAG
jgi:hypothetical protein